MKAEYTNVCKGYAENITEEVFSEIQSLIELYKSLAQIQTSEEVKEEAGDDDVGDEVEREEDEGEEDEAFHIFLMKRNNNHKIKNLNYKNNPIGI
ncbi:hypothetical protein PVBG_06296 [Plasmodium vivax Brazil I]|uniref:Uncharacterized protein n=1 Tax=Plasmodium vivax (strain Brazil I) TaxID=1033975 RepID=A0A0J9VB93_PLAV1|nr:hypothetical protein PVBG_06296 [Plasmodium vivax Brazil I]